MAFSIGAFLENFQLEAETAALLVARCTAAGLEEVIDLSLLEPEDIPAVLGSDAEALGPTLQNIIKRAAVTAEGWAGEQNMMGWGGRRAWAYSVGRYRRREYGRVPDARA